jgi:tetratricopeptide (TPR) repeat protein
MEDRENQSHPELPDYEHEPDSPVPVQGKGMFSAANRRRFLWIALLALLLLGIPPLYRTVKNLRAGSLVAQSSEAFAFGDPARGLQLIRQALSLSPGSPVVIHAAELCNARAGDKASMEVVTARMNAGTSGTDELLGIAEMLLQRDQAKEAAVALSRLPVSLSASQSLRRSLAEAGISAGNGDIDGAVALCLRDAASHRGAHEGRLRTQAALYLFRIGQQARTREAVGILTEVVRQRTNASLPAWRILARLALRSGSGSSLFTPGETARLASLFGALRGATSSDRLLCADLQIAADPSAMESIITLLETERKGAPRNEMLEYARWLNMHQMPRRVIDFAGETLPREDTDWLLIVLDARSALGEWKGIPALLESPAGQGVPDAVKHLYLARIATVSGHKERAEEEWRRVGGLLHLEKPETLAYIAGYEEQIGAYDRASRAYRELADRKETAALGLIGMIRCQPRTSPAGKLIPLYEELLRVSPGQPEAEGDLAYLRLLLNADVVTSDETARRLMEARPDSLASISTAALGRLRLGDPKGALRLYEGKSIDWSAAPEPWRAVRVAVLNANGDAVAASRLASTIASDRLRPEEAELLKGAKGKR